MTWLSRLLAFFPAMVVALFFALVGCAVWTGLWWVAPLAPLVFYVVPLVSFRIHGLFFPLQEGASHLDGERYSPWWGGHQIQAVLIAFPVFETALRLVPGLFSFWLRLWGSDIGRRVYWTPTLRLGDRGLLTVGDDVIFGYDCGLSSHLIKRTKKGRVLLLVKRITLGDRVFLGAGAIIGPGVRIDDDLVVDVGGHCYPGEHITEDRKRPREDREGAPDDAR